MQNSSAFKKDGSLDAQELSVAKMFKPSAMMQALTPLEERVTTDKFAHIKQKWLMEKYNLEKQIDKSNTKAEMLRKIINVSEDKRGKRQSRNSISPRRNTVIRNKSEEPSNLNADGYYSYINKMNEKDFRYKKFNEQIRKIQSRRNVKTNSYIQIQRQRRDTEGSDQ